RARVVGSERSRNGRPKAMSATSATMARLASALPTNPGRAGAMRSTLPAGWGTRSGLSGLLDLNRAQNRVAGAGPPGDPAEQGGRRRYQQQRYDHRDQRDAERDREPDLQEERNTGDQQRTERPGEQQRGRGDRRAGVGDGQRGGVAGRPTVPD